jgi:hypothetical protein
MDDTFDTKLSSQPDVDIERMRIRLVLRVAESARAREEMLRDWVIVQDDDVVSARPLLASSSDSDGVVVDFARESPSSLCKLPGGGLSFRQEGRALMDDEFSIHIEARRLLAEREAVYQRLYHTEYIHNPRLTLRRVERTLDVHDMDFWVTKHGFAWPKEKFWHDIGYICEVNAKLINLINRVEWEGLMVGSLPAASLPELKCPFVCILIDDHVHRANLHQRDMRNGNKQPGIKEWMQITREKELVRRKYPEQIFHSFEVISSLAPGTFVYAPSGSGKSWFINENCGKVNSYYELGTHCSPDYSDGE